MDYVQRLQKNKLLHKLYSKLELTDHSCLFAGTVIKFLLQPHQLTHYTASVNGEVSTVKQFLAALILLAQLM